MTRAGTELASTPENGRTPPYGVKGNPARVNASRWVS